MSYFRELSDHQNNVAIVEEHHRSLSYADLVHESDLLASYIGNRTLTFLLCTNTIASVVGYVGFLRNDIVPVLVDSELDPELLKKLIS